MSTPHALRDGALADASDADLIAAVRHGDDDAFVELWYRHSAAGRVAARSYRTGSEDAEDLVVEAFARIWEALRSGRGTGPSDRFRAYLYAVIRSVAIRSGREVRDTPAEDLTIVPDRAPTSEQRAQSTDSMRLLREAYVSLPEAWRRVIWYLDVEELPRATVAERLRLQPAAVSSLAYRARRGLRAAWVQQHVGQEPPLSEEHQFALAHFGAYEAGGLGPRDRRRVERHLRECAVCRDLTQEAQTSSKRLFFALLPIAIGAPGAVWLVAGAGATPAAAAVVGEAAAGSTGMHAGAAGGAAAGTGPAPGGPTGALGAHTAGARAGARGLGRLSRHAVRKFHHLSKGGQVAAVAGGVAAAAVAAVAIAAAVNLVSGDPPSSAGAGTGAGAVGAPAAPGGSGAGAGNGSSGNGAGLGPAPSPSPAAPTASASASPSVAPSANPIALAPGTSPLAGGAPLAHTATAPAGSSGGDGDQKGNDSSPSQSPAPSESSPNSASPTAPATSASPSPSFTPSPSTSATTSSSPSPSASSSPTESASPSPSTSTEPTPPAPSGISFAGTPLSDSDQFYVNQQNVANGAKLAGQAQPNAQVAISIEKGSSAASPMATALARSSTFMATASVPPAPYTVTVTATDEGAWSWEGFASIFSSSDYSDGDYALSITQEVEEQTSAATQFTAIVDTTPPEAPSITSVTWPHDDDGAGDTKPTLSIGDLEASSDVVVQTSGWQGDRPASGSEERGDGSWIASFTADSLTRNSLDAHSWEVPWPIPNGQTLVVRQIDSANNTSSSAPTATFYDKPWFSPRQKDRDSPGVGHVSITVVGSPGRMVQLRIAEQGPGNGNGNGNIVSCVARSLTLDGNVTFSDFRWNDNSSRWCHHSNDNDNDNHHHNDDNNHHDKRYVTFVATVWYGSSQNAPHDADTKRFRVRIDR